MITRELPLEHNGLCVVPTCPCRARWELVAGTTVYQVCGSHHEAVQAHFGDNPR
jgi:hypothetical protein